MSPPRPRESRPEKRRPDYKKRLDAKVNRQRRTTASLKRRGGLRRQQKVSTGRRTAVKAGSASAQAPARVALIAFYEEHNPSKLSSVDETLARYKGKEESCSRHSAKNTTWIHPDWLLFKMCHPVRSVSVQWRRNGRPSTPSNKISLSTD